MSAEGLVAAMASAVLVAVTLAIVGGILAERRRRPDTSDVLDDAEHLGAMAERIDRGEFDGDVDRSEQFEAFRLEATDVFDGVMLRDLERDARLAALHAMVRAALVRLRTAATPPDPDVTS